MGVETTGKGIWRGCWHWGFILVLVAVTIQAACAPSTNDSSLERVRSSGELVVGVDPSYPPFAADDGSGSPAGFDIDLAQEVARRLGVGARFVAVDVGGIHDGLLARKYDVIISSLPPFPELSKQISFSRPYFNAGQVLVVRREAVGIEGLADLWGRTVAIEAGSTADMEMRALAGKNPDLVIRRYSTADAALQGVRGDGADAAIVDIVSAYEFVVKTPAVKMVGSPITQEPYVMSTRRADAGLFLEIDRIVGELDGDGTLDRLRRKWLERVSG